MHKTYRVPTAFEVRAESKDEAYKLVEVMIAKRNERAPSDSPVRLVLGPENQVEEWKA